MTTERDLRENTRALIRLEKAIEALNNTLVEIERRQATAKGLGSVCTKCLTDDCVECSIRCSTNHPNAPVQQDETKDETNNV